MMVNVLALMLVLSALPQEPMVGQSPRPPVLAFPEPGLDDTAAYQGYQTRFYRDSEQNTFQIYLEPRSGRVVNLWANAANESIGFTARDERGNSAPLKWGSDNALAALMEISWAPGTAPKDASPFHKTIEYQLTSDVKQLQLGLFILGSMRVERDFQYQKRHLRPFTARPFLVPEESLLVATVQRLPRDLRQEALELLRAPTLAELRSRLLPTIIEPKADSTTTVRVYRQSVDGRNYQWLDLWVDSAEATARVSGTAISIRSRSGRPVRFTLRLSTDAASLTPLKRNEIFNQDFLSFLGNARSASDSAGRERYRRLERQVRAVELLSSEEKLMAGLPNYATYFGRDMMMSALMMQRVWTPAMSEHVIASVLRKLGPNGEVSHEEALGGQAIRENAMVYDSLITAYFRAMRTGRRARADSILGESREVLGALQRTRENYHMIDDEFQLPVLVARYLADSAVSPERKRAFLSDSAGLGGSRLALLLREMALVADWTRPYIEDPRPAKLVSFPERHPAGWRSASWRDSGAGYAGGRFAMDVNAIWAPHALQSFAVIFAGLDALGIRTAGLDSLVEGIEARPLGEFHRDRARLRAAIQTWRGSRRHFEVTLGPEAVQRRVQAKLAWLPPAERRYWERVMADIRPGLDSVFFLALSLDPAGKPIPVVNTDPATGLFLENAAPSAESEKEALVRDLNTFVLPYPIGLFVDSLGPLVANDAYASRQVWERFRKDTYHSPRVVWGREVNLLLLGLAKQMHGESDSVAQQMLRRTTAAVAASGLGHNELWGYRIDGGRLLPVRHAGMEMTTDIQLWNTTDLAVEFVLSQKPLSESP